MKKAISLFLVLVMMISMSVPALLLRAEKNIIRFKWSIQIISVIKNHWIL